MSKVSLEVAGQRRVELLGGDRAIAAMIAATGDIDLQLLFDGQREELPRRRQQGFERAAGNGCPAM